MTLSTNMNQADQSQDMSSRPTTSGRTPWNKRPENIARLREYAKEYYRQNKDAHRARTYRNRTPERSIFYAARVRAKKSGLEFNITLEDIKIPEFCPVLGIPLAKSKGKLSDGSPILDRRDNSLGYVKGNVFVISNKANRCKSDLTFEEIEALYRYVSGLEI